MLLYFCFVSWFLLVSVFVEEISFCKKKEKKIHWFKIVLMTSFTLLLISSNSSSPWLIMSINCNLKKIKLFQFCRLILLKTRAHLIKRQIILHIGTRNYSIFFVFLIWIHSIDLCKVGQPQQGMELQEEEQKNYKDTRKLFRENLQIKLVYWFLT